MIDYDIFARIKLLVEQSHYPDRSADVQLALMEELGEYARAVRVENGSPTCRHKSPGDGSKVELIDLMLVATEAYILRGGTIKEFWDMCEMKLDKWKSIIDKVNNNVGNNRS